MRNWKKVLIISLCVFLVACMLAAGYITKLVSDNEYTLELTLEGDSEIFLEYGESYVPQGATAKFWGSHIHTKPVAVEVVVDGTVNEQVVGTSMITYTAKYKGLTKTAYRTVHVYDHTAPVISLITDPDKYTIPGQPYEEEGYTASDNYDGDITDRVSRQEVDGKVIYTVSDSSGNIATQTREIVYRDPEAPFIKLTGGNTLAMTAGKPYVDPGFTAQDDIDGNLTGKVTVTGTVDGYQPGEYTLTYTVTDSYGNTTTVTRVVTVAPHAVQEYVENPQKVIYLTFDDGPGPYTARLLDILRKYNVKATFFVVNTDYIETIRRTAAEGHTIAVHTASHVFKEVYASEDAYFKDFYKMQSIVKELTGIETTLLRFPGGTSNTISKFNPGIMTRLSKLVKEKGFRYFDWNVDSDDAGRATTSEEVFENVVNGIGGIKNSVVLQHDIKGFSVDAVERIINWGLENGYTFLPLTSESPSCEHPAYN